MLDTIDSTLRDQCGLVKDRPIIAGVSGGPDSLCLMGVLRKAGYRLIYHVSDRRVTVTVIRVARRDKDEAYAKLLERMAQLDSP